MKTIVAILGIGLLAASCNTSGIRERDFALEAQQNTIDSMKIEIAKQQVIDSMNYVAGAAALVAADKAPAVAKAPARKAKKTTRSYTTYREPVRENTTQSYGGYSNTQPVAQTQPAVYQEPVTQEKKGWSAKAKGAVIGGVAGAAGGAIINKRQRAVGAVVGGILGAGAGTGIGAIIDKKNGR